MIVPCCYVVNRVSTAFLCASVFGFCDAFALLVHDHSSFKLIGGSFRELTQEFADDVAAALHLGRPFSRATRLGLSVAWQRESGYSCCSKLKLPLLVDRPFERIHDENCKRAYASYGGCGWR